MSASTKIKDISSANRSNQNRSSGKPKSARGNGTGGNARKTGTTKQTAVAGSSSKTASSGNRKKTSSTKANAGNAKNSRKSGTSRSIEEMNEYQDHLAFEQGMTLLVMGVVTLICYLSYLGFAGGFGTVIGGLLFGLFGWVAWFVPIGAMVALAGVIVNQHDKRMRRKIISAVGVGLLLSALTDLIGGAKVLSEYYQANYALHRNGAASVYMALRDSLHLGKTGGGLLGRLISNGLVAVLGKIGAGFIIVALLCVCIYLFYGVEMMQHLRKRNAYYQEMEQAYEVIQTEDYQKPSYQIKISNPRRKLYSGRRMQTVNLQQMGEQLDRQEQERQKNRKVVEISQDTHAKIEEIIPDQKAGMQGRRQAEEIRSQHLQEEKDQLLHTETPIDTTSESSVEAAAAIDDIPIYREEMQQKFGRKKKESGLLQDGGNVVVELDMAKPGRSVAASQGETEEDIVQEQAFATEDPSGLEQNMELGQDSVSEIPSELAIDAHSELIGMPETDVSAKVIGLPEMDASTREAGLPESDASANVTKLPMEDASAKAAELPESGVSAKVAKPLETGGPSKTIGASQVQKSLKPVPDKKQTAGTQGMAGEKKPQEKAASALSEEIKEKPKRPHQFPSIDLLSVPDEIPGRTSDEELRNTALKLQETLRSFNVNVTMGAVTCGPTVTRYELLPEQGVRVNKITNLSDDLKLSMAATSIRIEAPIPGKAAVGIEVPNSTASPVYFRELLEGDAFQKAKSPITFAVGKDIAGKRIMTDIAKMPHLLIAGATGSGKSVCINTLIMSILYKADPSDVKLIMIDPKVVELSVYNGIPHLFCPVVTDPKEAAASLNWAVREMMERYNKFKELGVRNISGYNQKIKTVEDAEKAGYTKMPSLVIIVDEFADLMMVASKEVEDAVCRLAQLARAAGIHLVLATQRPSVNVITCVIKANIPSRIAFSVSSAIDSRTILDKGGAEKLLGKGDMLFFPAGYSEPVRVQGAFISDKEVSDVVSYLIEANEQPEYNNAVTEIIEETVEPAESKEEKKKPDHDEYFEEAGKFVIESERAAAGQLQRRFSIGFNRAGRIIDQLHQAGVIGPAEGTKPRKVLMTMAEFEASLHGVDASASAGEAVEDVLLDMDEFTGDGEIDG